MQGVLYLDQLWSYDGAPPIQLNGVPLSLRRVIEAPNSRTYVFEVPSILNLAEGDNMHGIGIPGFKVGMVREWNNEGWGSIALNNTGYGQGCLPRWRLGFCHNEHGWRGAIGFWRAPAEA